MPNINVFFTRALLGSYCWCFLTGYLSFFQFDFLFWILNFVIFFLFLFWKRRKVIVYDFDPKRWTWVIEKRSRDVSAAKIWAIWGSYQIVYLYPMRPWNAKISIWLENAKQSMKIRTGRGSNFWLHRWNNNIQVLLENISQIGILKLMPLERSQKPEK